MDERSTQQETELSLDEINNMLLGEADREADGKRRMLKYKRLSHDGKICYRSEWFAQGEVNRLEDISTIGEVYQIYRCRFCDDFHIGHATDSPRQKKHVELLLNVKDNIPSVMGYRQSYEAGEAAYLGEKIKTEFADGDGMYMLRGALIYSRRSGRDIVGESIKLATFDPSEWETIDIG